MLCFSEWQTGLKEVRKRQWRWLLKSNNDGNGPRRIRSSAKRESFGHKANGGSSYIGAGGETRENNRGYMNILEEIIGFLAGGQGGRELAEEPVALKGWLRSRGDVVEEHNIGLSCMLYRLAFRTSYLS
ncbi:Hypothetical predicted protein [Olea europaea subsp. europaea]|uniref:Uncharacterized protein n=1 Tax=Olea europaea subsp. europaea TaxID=158383 RepID=A0A8S0U357_OLEEU|nr:Hypothetical predicted protein [Olea europaea subsp. europaea]